MRGSGRKKASLKQPICGSGSGRGLSKATYRRGIPCNQIVDGQQYNALHDRLSNQDPIEGVLMDSGKPLHGYGMLACDWQLIIAVVDQAPAQKTRIDRKVRAAQTPFDCDLPETCSTERQVVVGILDLSEGGRRELVGLARRPEQKMGIEQKFHASPPNSFSISSPAMRSKSSGTENCPAINPTRRVSPAAWEPKRDLRVNAIVGRRRPLHAGSSKAFLAHMGYEEREAILSGPLKRFTKKTVTDPRLLRVGLEQIRKAKFFVSRGEINDDLISITAPVFVAPGKIIAALNIAAPENRVPEERISELGDMVAQAAHRISAALGFRSPAAMR